MIISGRRRRAVPAGNRARPDSVLARENWGVFDLNSLREPPDQGDNTVTSVPATGNTYAALRFGFEDPAQPISGPQKFRARIRCTVTGGSLRAWLYEGGALKRDFGTVQLSGTSFQLVTFSWNASEVSDSRNVELKLLVYCNRSSGNYELDAVDWLINVAGDDLAWPAGWGPRPQLGSHHGLGNAFDLPGSDYKPLTQYNNWLGRPANIAKAWALSSGVNIDSWDDVAGGSGDDITVFSGQFNDPNPRACFNNNIWPVNLPVVLACYCVPDHSGFRNVTNYTTWRNPSIWSEIKTGTYDTFIRRMWRRLAYQCQRSGRDPRTLVIRFCHEANGNWYPWSIGPDKQSFIDGWRRCIDLMREEFRNILGQGAPSPLVEFGPSRHLRFGAGSSERLWNIYPGDDWVDIVGLGIHDHVGVQTQADWDAMLTKSGDMEGIREWFDFGASRNKWLGTSEIECNYEPRQYFPKTENMNVFWTTGFEPLRRRYDGRFLYFIYLWWTPSYLIRSDGWGEPYRQLYKPGGTGEQSGGGSGGSGSATAIAHLQSYSSYTAASAWQAGQLSIPSSGELLLVVVTIRDTAFVSVSQINHPGISNQQLLAADQYDTGTGVRLRVELWRCTAAQASGTLQLNFNATSYFHAVHVYHCTNLPSYKTRSAASGTYVSSLQTAASAAGATVGIAAAATVLGSNSANINIAPWADQVSYTSPGSYYRTRVHTRVANDVSGQTQTVLPTQDVISGLLCAYLF